MSQAAEATTQPVDNTLANAIVEFAKITGLSTQEVFDMYRGTRNLLHACHSLAAKGGWWSDLETGQPKERNRGELLMLMVSELAEAMEGERKSLMDDHLPHRKMAEVELADALIREGDYAGGFGYDVAAAMIEKLVYNQHRADHKIENRQKADGKKF